MAVLKALLPMEEDSTRRAVARKVKLVLGTDRLQACTDQIPRSSSTVLWMAAKNRWTRSSVEHRSPQSRWA